MKKWMLITLFGALTLSAAIAADWSLTYRPAALRYALYGGGLGDPITPTQGDRKVAFELTGKAAREVFDAIGPDRVDECTSESDTRFRSRDEDRLSCTRSVKGDYACYFGFDLKSGKSVGGSVC